MFHFSDEKDLILLGVTVSDRYTWTSRKGWSLFSCRKARLIHFQGKIGDRCDILRDRYPRAEGQ